MTIWLTADLHLDHENILKYCNRPFHSVGEMNSVLLWNIAETVKSDDTLYVLGDLAFREETFRESRAMLKELCDVLFVHGNHDSKKWAKTDPLALDFRHNKRHFYCCHYPWQSFRPNTVMLHGHTHGNPIEPSKDSRQLMRYDVGVDTVWSGRKYFPVSIEQVEARIKNIESEQEDK